MTQFIQKILKSIAYATAGGAITIGAGQVNLVNVDFSTIVYLVVTSVLFNAAREYLKIPKQ